MNRGSTLILVRHGETEGQSSIRYYGRTDLALSELGRAQMRAVREALKRRHGNPRFARVFASPLRRAQESARVIAGADATAITIDEFVEVDFGFFEGLTSDEIRERYPRDFELWNRNRLAPDYAYPGGERRSAFAARVSRGLDRMLKLWDADPSMDGRCALVVAHRGVIRVIARELAGAEPTIELGSITILKFDDAWQVGILDATEHLAELGALDSKR